ncbi:hypothetical protein [uncultured Polaribacter sp.]|uniref:hypothetical protein n=1 Tax=uncultured Polaribacter sp. TaxID=174711 RepID=UPI00261F9097|nr:hypothetical protein [uncultured Polaribacter sp.]
MFCYSQNSVNFSLHHDFKLLVFGDNLGNRAGTLNFIARVKHEGEDNSLGFLIYGLEFEKAFLSTQYTRFGAFTGFTFMDVFNDYNFHITPSIGTGFINREQKNLFSWSGSVQFEYFLSDTVRLSFLNQITQRTDLEYLYNDLAYRWSFFLGIEMQLFKINQNN